MLHRYVVYRPTVCLQTFSAEDQSQAYKYLANYHLMRNNLDDAYAAAQKCTEFPEVGVRVYLITPPHWEHLIHYNFSHYILFILQSLNTFISNYLDIIKQHLPVHIFSLDTVVFCNSIIYRVTIFTLDFCLSN